MSGGGKSGKAKGAVAAAAAPLRDPLMGALAEAAWSEADRALAAAISELAHLERALSGLRDGRADALGAAEEAALLLNQALAGAARKRGFARFGAVGEVVRYDARRHELSAAGARAPAYVRIDAPGLARGTDILVKAHASRAKAPK